MKAWCSDMTVVEKIEYAEAELHACAGREWFWPISEALAAARSELSQPAHEREPPHCPSCSCGMKQVDVDRIRQIAQHSIETLRACHTHAHFSVGVAWAALGLILAEFAEEVPARPWDSAPECSYCRGNDRDMPCAYPSEGKPGCLRDIRLRREDQLKKDHGNVNE